MVPSALLSQSRIWKSGSILTFLSPNKFRLLAKVVSGNSVTLDMSGSFLVMMLLYLWPTLLLVVIWITVTHFSGVSKCNLRKLQSIQNSAARTVLNNIRYASITPVLKKLLWLPVQHRPVFNKTATLVNKFLHTGFFPSILIYISLPTAVLIVPGTVRVVVISLWFQSSNPLSINLSAVWL